MLCYKQIGAISYFFRKTTLSHTDLFIFQTAHFTLELYKILIIAQFNDILNRNNFVLKELE